MSRDIRPLSPELKHHHLHNSRIWLRQAIRCRERGQVRLRSSASNASASQLHSLRVCATVPAFGGRVLSELSESRQLLRPPNVSGRPQNERVGSQLRLVVALTFSPAGRFASSGSTSIPASRRDDEQPQHDTENDRHHDGRYRILLYVEPNRKRNGQEVPDHHNLPDKPDHKYPRTGVA